MMRHQNSNNLGHDDDQIPSSQQQQQQQYSTISFSSNFARTARELVKRNETLTKRQTYIAQFLDDSFEHPTKRTLTYYNELQKKLKSRHHHWQPDENDADDDHDHHPRHELGARRDREIDDNHEGDEKQQEEENNSSLAGCQHHHHHVALNHINSQQLPFTPSLELGFLMDFSIRERGETFFKTLKHIHKIASLYMTNRDYFRRTTTGRHLEEEDKYFYLNCLDVAKLAAGSGGATMLVLREEHRQDPLRRNSNLFISNNTEEEDEIGLTMFEKLTKRGMNKVNEMQRSLVPYLARRLLLLMRMFYCSFEPTPASEDDAIDRSSSNHHQLFSDDDESFEEETSHNNFYSSNSASSSSPTSPPPRISPSWLRDTAPSIVKKLKSIVDILLPKCDDQHDPTYLKMQQNFCFNHGTPTSVLFSEIAPLLIDLSAFEIVYGMEVGLLSKVSVSTLNKKKQQQTTSHNPSPLLSPTLAPTNDSSIIVDVPPPVLLTPPNQEDEEPEQEDKEAMVKNDILHQAQVYFQKHNPRFVKRGNHGVVAIDTSFNKVVSSGFSGKTFGWCKRWIDHSESVCCFKEDEKDRLGEREDVLSRQRRQEEERIRREMYLSRSNLIRSFMKTLMNKKSEDRQPQEQENQQQQHQTPPVLMILPPPPTSAINSPKLGKNPSSEQLLLLEYHQVMNNNNEVTQNNDDDNILNGLSRPENILRLPFEVTAMVFEYLLPSEMHSAGLSCRAWQRVILARIPLRRMCQLAQTFTRRVNHFIMHEFSEQCCVIDFCNPGDEQNYEDESEYE